MTKKIDRTRRGGDCLDRSCFCKNPEEGKEFWKNHPDELKRYDCLNLLCPCKLPLSKWPAGTPLVEEWDNWPFQGGGMPNFPWGEDDVVEIPDEYPAAPDPDDEDED